MRIKSLYYKNHNTGWQLGEKDKPVEFGEINLLVGVSGVGKSMILKAIERVQEFALSYGKSFPNEEWKIQYSDNFNNEVIWEGKFDNSKPSSNVELNNDLYRNKNNAPILFEKLTINSTTLFENNDSKLLFKEKEYPYVEVSCFELFRNDESIIEQGGALYHIGARQALFWRAPNPNLIAEIKNSDNEELNVSGNILSPHIRFFDKLIVMSQFKKSKFEDITTSFKNIFPLITEIKIEDEGSGEKENFRIKIKDHDTWVDQNNISSGMIKTLALLTQIHATPPEAVVLIDEFENSLGINCIDKIADELMNLEHPFQMIFTSHHADIISKIPVEHWRIVQRKGSVVKLHKAEEFKIGTSKHSAYSNLLNNPQFEKSIQ
jgi:Fe-S cluster assembly ATPase SufC